MRGEERFYRGRFRCRRIACRDSAKKLQKFFGGSHRKPVMGMSDDVGVDVFSEMKAYGKASRAGTVRIVIGHSWNARKVRETNSHRRSFSLYVKRPRKRSCLWRRRK